MRGATQAVLEVAAGGVDPVEAGVLGRLGSAAGRRREMPTAGGGDGVKAAQAVADDGRRR